MSWRAYIRLLCLSVLSLPSLSANTLFQVHPNGHTTATRNQNIFLQTSAATTEYVPPNSIPTNNVLTDCTNNATTCSTALACTDTSTRSFCKDCTATSTPTLQCTRDLNLITKIPPTQGCNLLNSNCQKPLSQVIFAGTTNSALLGNTYDYEGNSIYDCTLTNQHLSIQAQLERGIRYLDISLGVDSSNTLVAISGLPKTNDKDKLTDKPSNYTRKWIKGLRIRDVIKSILSFLIEYPNEIIILHFSSFQQASSVIVDEVASGKAPKNSQKTRDGHFSLVKQGETCTTDCLENVPVATYKETTKTDPRSLLISLLNEFFFQNKKNGLSWLVKTKDWYSGRTMGDILGDKRHLLIVSDMYLSKDVESYVLPGTLFENLYPVGGVLNEVYPSACQASNGNFAHSIMSFPFNAMDQCKRTQVAAFGLSKSATDNWFVNYVVPCYNGVLSTRSFNVITFDHYQESPIDVVAAVLMLSNENIASPITGGLFTQILKYLAAIIIFGAIIIIGFFFYFYASKPLPPLGGKPQKEKVEGEENETDPLIESSQAPTIGFQATVMRFSNRMKNSFNAFVGKFGPMAGIPNTSDPTNAGENVKELPAGWERWVDDDTNKPYLYNAAKGISVWEGEEIETHVDEQSGKRYQYNVITEESIWLDGEPEIQEQPNEQE